MDPTNGGERSGMAKVSKSLFLNEEISRLVDQYQDEKGLSFTRIVTAALLQFLLDGFHGADDKWVRQATRLDKGQTTLPDVWRAMAGARLSWAEHLATDAAVEATRTKSKDSLRTYQDRALKAIVSQIATWEAKIGSTPNPIDGLTEMVIRNPWVATAPQARTEGMREAAEADETK